MVRAHAPGNVFLFGEHAVVYGTPAVIAATSLQTTVDLEGRADDAVVVDSLGFGAFQSSVPALRRAEFPSAADYVGPLDLLKDLIGTFLRRLPAFPALSGFHATVTSDIPRDSGGMSSSTAVLSALLHALGLHYPTAALPVHQFFDFLHPFQVKVHGGAASGAEILSSALGGYNLVRIVRGGGGGGGSPPPLGTGSQHRCIAVGVH